jgi:uncharacterized protein (UPF0276 family)
MNRQNTNRALAGLGLRRPLMKSLREQGCDGIDFFEVAPENWCGIGGRSGAEFAELTAARPLFCHGLSLNLGGSAALDREFIQAVGGFLAGHQAVHYSEHLAACADDGMLYDLMPLPFTEEMVLHVAGRIRQVQDMLGRRIAVENVSAYARLRGPLTEQQFLLAVLDEADCDLLLDVNNVYVNACNFSFDPHDFIAGLPTRRIACLHVAGHLLQPTGLRIDTHGEAVIDPVWQLLAFTYARHGVQPTLLERDFNLPPLSSLLAELQVIHRLQQQAEEA